MRGFNLVGVGAEHLKNVNFITFWHQTLLLDEVKPVSLISLQLFSDGGRAIRDLPLSNAGANTLASREMSVRAYLWLELVFLVLFRYSLMNT